MHRLVMLVLIVSAFTGCKGSSQTTPEKSWPHVLWQIPCLQQAYIREIVVAPDQGFIVILNKELCIGQSRTYLQRYSSNGVLQNSLELDFSISPHEHSI